LTVEEADAVLAGAIADHDPDFWLFVTLGFHTSMRHSELRSLRWQDFSAADQRFHIGKAKAGARSQPLSSAITRLLIAEKKRRGVTHGQLFPPGPGSKTAFRHTFRKAFQRAVIRAGLDPDIITPHVMRHTAITKFVQANIDLSTIQKLSGHKTLSQVLRYAHVHAAHINEAADKISMPLPTLK
jgi:integrase